MAFFLSLSFYSSVTSNRRVKITENIDCIFQESPVEIFISYENKVEIMKMQSYKKLIDESPTIKLNCLRRNLI